MNNQPNPRICSGPAIPACRRCGRPLRTPATAAAGIGARCALLDALETARAAVEQAPAPDVSAAAIALVAARLGGLPKPVAEAILDDAPAAELAVLLAALAAWMIDHTTGGEQWLRRLGLAWAREVDA